MITARQRIKLILQEVPGPERGRQVRLSEIAGCSRGLIHQWLSDKQPEPNIGYEQAKNIEDRMGFRVEWTMKGAEPQKLTDAEKAERKERKAEAELLDGDDVIKLLALFRQSTVEARRNILEFAETQEKIPNAPRLFFPARDHS